MGESQDNVFILSGIIGKSNSDPYKESEKWVTEALESLAEQAEKIDDPVAFRPLCIGFGPYGV